jgi:uncharacterized protein YigE (DUF2233 family)
MLKKTVFVACLLAFLGGSCLPQQNAKTPKTGAAAWQNIADNVGRYECSAAVCGARLIIYRFAKDKFTWHFVARDTPSTVEAWAKSLPSAAFVANGVYFDEKWQPTGMLVVGGKTVNNRVYDYAKSGVLELAPAVRVIDTAVEKIDAAKFSEAGQSFPLIIKNGSPIKTFKDEHGARRSMIGNDTEGNVYFAAIPEDAVTFPEAAKLLAATGVKWTNVLNLDGGTSTGFAAKLGDFSEAMNSIVQVPIVIVAEKK